MSLDTLDHAVLVALALAIAAYFTKGLLWAVPDDGTKVQATSRDIVDTVRANNKAFLILYGSQTGTAEDYANKFAKELKSKFKLNVMVADIEDYDFENLNDLDVVTSIFMSTYGEGDFPDSCNEFEQQLADFNEGDLENFKYTLFGLGNTTYEFYNAASVKTNEMLTKVGAELIGPFGKGDDGAGTLDEDYLSWKESTIDVLKERLHLSEHDAIFEPSLRALRIDPDELDESKIFYGEPDRSFLDVSVDQSKGPYDHGHPYVAPISFSKELFNSSERSCIHAEFDLSQTNLRYSTGDHLAVWPSNSNEKLEKFLKITGLWEEKTYVFDLKPLDSTVVIPFPTPASVEAIFRHYKEIGGSVSRQLVANLKQYAPNDQARGETDRLGKNREEFAKEITSNKYDFAEVLELLSGGRQWSLPLDFLIESLPHLQPRYYSISSSSLTEKTTIHITAVVEAEVREDGRLITGVTTNLLRNIEIEQNKESSKPHMTYDLKGPRSLFSPFKLPVHVRRSTFRLPSNPATPVIMIGPGTGVAPFRGFVRDRVKQVENGTKNLGKTLLFYGSRTSTEDFLYKEEWPQYAKVLGDSFEMITAFSRETSKKVYVQHKLKERSDEISKLLDQNAFIYVCGDAAGMAHDVNHTLAEILSNSKGITVEEGHELLKGFKTTNRYQEDVW